MYVTLREILPVTLESIDDYITLRFRFKIVDPFPGGTFSLQQENAWIRERQDWCLDNIGESLFMYDEELRFMHSPNCYNTAASWHQTNDEWRFQRSSDAFAFKLRWVSDPQL